MSKTGIKNIGYDKSNDTYTINVTINGVNYKGRRKTLEEAKFKLKEIQIKSGKGLDKYTVQKAKGSEKEYANLVHNLIHETIKDLSSEEANINEYWKAKNKCKIEILEYLDKELYSSGL